MIFFLPRNEYRVEEAVEKVFQDGIGWMYFLRVLKENRNVSTRSLSTRE